jgi:hypothetical protein
VVGSFMAFAFTLFNKKFEFCESNPGISIVIPKVDWRRFIASFIWLKFWSAINPKFAPADDTEFIVKSVISFISNGYFTYISTKKRT